MDNVCLDLQNAMGGMIVKTLVMKLIAQVLDLNVRYLFKQKKMRTFNIVLKETTQLVFIHVC